MTDPAPPPAPDLVVAYEQPDDAPRAEALAGNLGVPCAGCGRGSNHDLSLVLADGAWWLRDHRRRGLKPLRADFESRESPSKKQPLGRAVGRVTRTVLDATAGWGDDSRRLCAMGYAVTAVERQPVMAALLADAADRAARAGAANVPRIVAADAIEWLADRAGQWDCVYLDPMFPPKRRASALARRSLRLLRELAGDDPDRDRLFAAARTAAAKRVVVKRPDHSEPLFGEPGEVVAGKLVCYDVYPVL